MLIVLALLFGVTAGLVVHFAMPHRGTRGPALIPMAGAVLGGGVWLLMTWLGLEESGWIWLASIVVPLAVTWPLTAVLTRTRLAHDERERVRLKIA